MSFFILLTVCISIMQSSKFFTMLCMTCWWLRAIHNPVTQSSRSCWTKLCTVALISSLCNPTLGAGLAKSWTAHPQTSRSRTRKTSSCIDLLDAWGILPLGVVKQFLLLRPRCRYHWSIVFIWFWVKTSLAYPDKMHFIQLWMNRSKMGSTL